MGLHVALFRGINVGHAKRVPMDGLRLQLERLGYAGVQTLLNSGNAVFRARTGAPASHAGRIRTAVAGGLGVDAAVVVLTASEFAAAQAENPLTRVATDLSRLFAAFTQDRSELAPLAVLGRQRWAPDQLALGKHAAYLWCPKGALKSPLWAAVGRALGDRVTTRNWATVMKIGEALDSAAE